MERETPRGGGQDATIAAVVAVLIFIGTFVAYYYLALKPKVEEIAALESQKQSKINELKQKLETVKEQKNYEVRLAVLHDQWDENKHWFINGLINWTDRKDVAQTQFNIFQLYERIVDIGRASGIDVDNRSTDDYVPFQIAIDETIKFYLDDEPYDFPNEYFFLMEDLTFEPNFRFPQDGAGGLGSVTTEGKSLFNSHNFSVQFQAPYETISTFTKNLQQRFGQEDTLVAVHCYSSDGDPVPRTRFSPFSPVNTTSVEIAVQMYCTAYSIFDAPGIAINTPPNLPGETDCKGGSGGSRGGGGGGGGGGGASGGGGMSLGAG